MTKENIDTIDLLDNKDKAISPKVLNSGNNGFAIRLPICPMCGSGEVKKEKHHIIPKFLKPVVSITLSICKPCHQRINSVYVKYPSLASKNVSNNFVQFRENYDKLRISFNNKKLNRGQFGESLHTNLVTFLESIDSRITKMEDENDNL